MKKWFIAAALFLFTAQSHAYLGLMTSGEMLEPQQFQIMGYLESIFDEIDGLNVNARGTLGLSDELQADIELGLGELDVMLGAFLKWVPFPDTDNQPAIGVRAGISYIDYKDYSQTSVIAMPLISKKFQTNEYGLFVPYAGLPLGVNSNDKDTYFTTRLALGTEWTHPEQPKLHGIAEVGFELSKSFSSLNIGASYDF